MAAPATNTEVTVTTHTISLKARGSAANRDVR